MSEIRNTKPRQLVDRPKENYKETPREELNALLKKISTLRSEELLMVMTAISEGLIDQRNMAAYRAVDFETAVANIANKPKGTATPKTWRWILDNWLLPHRSALRTGDMLIEAAEKLAKGAK